VLNLSKGIRSIPLTYEERQYLRSERSKDAKRKHLREGRLLDVFGNDPRRTGEAILAYAIEYRKKHPDAPLTECVDDWYKKIKGTQKNHKLHGPDSAKFLDDHPVTDYEHKATGLDTNGDAVSTDNPLLDELKRYDG
jgi:hypothetical protein